MITVFLDIELGHIPLGPPGNTHPKRSKHVVLPIPVVNAYGLHRLCHGGTSTPQFRSSIKESGQVRITKTDKITVHPKPPIMLVLLRSFLIDDKGMNTLPLGKSLGTGPSGGIEVSLECLEL